MKKILVAENHPITYIGLERFLQDHLDNPSIHLAEDFGKALAQLGKQKFDLLIMDINIPDGDKIGMINSVRKIQSSIPILIYSSYDEKLYGPPFIKAGANGYISKTASCDEFLLAVTKVLNNQLYVSSDLLSLVFGHFSNPSQARASNSHKLSPKEFEIANLLVKGLTTKEIGGKVNLSASSVSTYKTKIFERLGVRNTISLMEYFKMN